ncbi:MAG: TIGR03086 family metal-binding protein [Acidimicrobiales bacterium]
MTGYYNLVADDFDRVFRAVREEQWGAPTPCEEWTVRQLACHVVETHRRALAILYGNDFEPVGHDDVRHAWREASSRVRDARDDPGLAARVVSGLGRDQSFRSLVEGLLTFDTLTHTWDLAHAIGADEALNPDAVAYAHDALAPFSEVLRGPGGYGPALEAAPDASAQTRFLAFTGRRPRVSPRVTPESRN